MWLNNTGVSEDRRNAIDVMYRAIRLFEDLGPKMRVSRGLGIGYKMAGRNDYP
jgi:hypothetical protein